MPVKGLYGGPELHVPFWSMIYVALKFTFSVSETELEFQWQVHYGTEWHVESSFPNMPFTSISKIPEFK